jgi:tripartite-type tricarboxylate transporter receptor subunit TctC
MSKIFSAIIAVFVACAPAIAFADSPGDFFKGKVITYIVSTAPGGGYDTYGRLVARYMQNHIPGSKIIVRNVPGAGHVVGANTIYASKPDGLTFGTFDTGLILLQLLQDKGIRFDLAKMSWIGKAASDTRVLVMNKQSGITKPDVLFDTSKPPIKLNSAGVGSAVYFDIKIAIYALHMNVDLIPGYNGNEGIMSMLRDETRGTIGSASSYAEFVQQGNGRYVMGFGGPPGMNIPQADDYAKTPDAKSLVNIVDAEGKLSRLTAGPPGIPADRLDFLRKAYMAALTDPKLQADAKKMQIPVDPANGDEVAKTVTQALNQSPENIKLIAQAVKSK